MSAGEKAVLRAMQVQPAGAAPDVDATGLGGGRFREILETVSEVFWSVEPALVRVLYVSSAYEQIWGRSRASLYAHPRSFIEAIHEADRDRVRACLSAKDNGQPFEIEYRVVRPDGTERWIWDRGYPVRAADGRLTHFVGVAVDLSEHKRVENALREREQQMRLFLEATSDCVWNWDLETGRIERSSGFSRAFGYAADEIDASLAWWEVRLHPDDRPRVIAELKNAMAAGAGTCAYEYRFRRRDDTYAVIQDRGHLVWDAAGRLVRALGAMTDITEQRRAEAALRGSEERFRAIYRKVVRLSSDMISFAPERIDTGIRGALAEIGIFAGVDRSYVFLFDEARGRVTNTHEWCAPGVAPEIQRLQNLPVDDFPWVTRQLLRGEVVHVPRVRELPDEARAEREEWQVESIRSILLVPMSTSSGVMGYVGFDAVRDEKTWPDELIVLLRFFGEIVFSALTRRQAATALRENRVLASAEQRLRSLSRRLVEVQEEAQRRLSSELHDGIGQNLAALGADLAMIRALIPPGSPRLDALLLEAQQLVDGSVASMRSVISELRPPTLDEYGLLAGLRWYGNQIRARTGMATLVDGEEPVPRLPGPVEWEMFRIAQEALTNTVKHARARNATIRLTSTGATTTLLVADDGNGFDPLAMAQSGPRPHWGLTMMRERAETVGARLQVESAPGCGTRIVLAFTRP